MECWTECPPIETAPPSRDRNLNKKEEVSRRFLFNVRLFCCTNLVFFLVLFAHSFAILIMFYFTLLGLLLCSGLGLAQFPPKPEGLSFIRSRIRPGASICYKSVCVPMISIIAGGGS